jgi:hypothetical protein
VRAFQYPDKNFLKKYPAMPVEIRELQITAVVQEAASQAAATSSTSTNTVNNENIIAECVEQVLEILKQKSER